MVFTSLISHTFFLLKEHEGKESEQYTIKKEAQIHGTIFKELKSKRTHIIIVRLERPIDNFRFAKLDRYNFSID